MPKSRAQRRSPSRRRSLPPTASLVAALLLAGVLATAAAGQGTKRVVAEGQSESLGKTVLTNLKGRTLYSLSVEKQGKFICKGTCLADWHPLLVPKGVKPTGPVDLGTVVRPEGSRQVTYRGLPLYRFDADSKKGEANGEGIKDVGTWHAATPPQHTRPAATEPPGAYPGGY